ncbi:hypothetical protein RHSIM_Rhsim12G0095900 [Rhododendron simsii]|uniref:Uncharacterized protein n=1 Tax=Rhododendron simsii TaxID=118357 RepID=A0A834G0R6_RHOSS|nr:hypothetical protein RHSIM_Rhsim12G0095900 [Rhododendron simsii]
MGGRRDVILPKSMGSTARKMRTMKMDDRPGFSLQVFARGVDVDTVVLMAARASRVESQDAMDTAIVGTLINPKRGILISI